MLSTGDIDLIEPVNWGDPLAQSLGAWWRYVPGWMGGALWLDLVDQRHATLTGGMLPETALSGPGPTARQGGDGEIRFDGSNDYGLLPTLPAIGNNRTVSAWFNGTWSNSGIILNATDWSCSFGPYGPSTLMLFNPFTDTTYGGGISTAGLTNNTWHHFVGVFGFQLLVAAYLDGVSATVSSTLEWTVSAGNTIGARNSGAPTTFLTGRLDDLAVWGRQLSSGEVWRLYQSSLAGHPTLLRRRVRRYYSVPAAGGISLAALAAANRHFLGTGVA